MKKLLIVNNNMKIGGVQKSLYNLLWSITGKYDITLFLFCKTGEYVNSLPPEVRIIECTSLFRYLGISQSECRDHLRDRLMRGCLAACCKFLGFRAALRVILLSQRCLKEEYDCAISYLHNGSYHSFYGGTNEFVLKKVNAKKKIAFLHGDYRNCGSNTSYNNKTYAQFDQIAACSDGCRKAFSEVLPSLASKCITVKNCNRYDRIRILASEDPKVYEKGKTHVLVVARLSDTKAVDRAIQGAAAAIAAGFPLSLHIIGDGTQMQQLQQLATSLKIEQDVFFYGEQSNPYRYMINADLLLLTSRHEAAPLVIDEARCVGLPVLSVQTTSSEEMILQTHCGWICPNSQEGINKALLSLLNQKECIQECRDELRSTTVDNQLAVQQFLSLIEGTT